jgi:hypothetical protein
MEGRDSAYIYIHFTHDLLEVEQLGIAKVEAGLTCVSHMVICCQLESLGCCSHHGTICNAYRYSF